LIAAQLSFLSSYRMFSFEHIRLGFRRRLLDRNPKQALSGRQTGNSSREKSASQLASPSSRYKDAPRAVNWKSTSPRPKGRPSERTKVPNPVRRYPRGCRTTKHRPRTNRPEARSSRASIVLDQRINGRQGGCVRAVPVSFLSLDAEIKCLCPGRRRSAGGG